MKNKFLLILLIFQITCIAAVLFFQRPLQPVDADLFRLPEPEKIDQVIFTSATGKTTLIFSRNKWQVNGREADLQRVKVFFAAWIQSEPRRKITGPAADSLRRMEGVEVEFFQAGVSRKKFRVTGRGEETYYIKDRDVYLAAIPGYRVALYDIFAMDEAEWRKKRIFDFNWTKFKELQATFSNPKENFTVSFNGKYFGLKGMQADTARLNNYLDAVSLLEAARFLKKNEPAAAGKPLIRLEVKDTKDSTYALTVYPEMLSGRHLAKTGNDFLWLDKAAWNTVSTAREKFLPKKEEDKNR